MLLLNFAHPLTTEHLRQLKSEIQVEITEVRRIPVHFEDNRPYFEQARLLADQVGLSADEWQTQSVLINPPAHAGIAVCLLVELHARLGYFPRVLRMKPAAGQESPFAVAEVIDLRDERVTSRRQREGG